MRVVVSERTYFISYSDPVWPVSFKMFVGESTQNELRSIDQFIQDRTVYTILGAESTIIGGFEPMNYKRGLDRVLPPLVTFGSVRIQTNGNKPFIIRKLEGVTGYGVRLRIPLRHSYTKQSRELFENQIADSNSVYAYRDAFLETVELVDDLPDTCYFLVQDTAYTPEIVDEMEGYLSGLTKPYFKLGN